MDIQFVAESSLALANYVTAYVTKPEKSNLQEVWQSISDDKMHLAASTASEVGACVAKSVVSIRLQTCHALLKTSCEVKYIDTSLPAKRK